MHSSVQPWQILHAALAGWVNRHQQHIIECLQEENRVLKEQLEGKQLRLTDNRRRRLAVIFGPACAGQKRGATENRLGGVAFPA